MSRHPQPSWLIEEPFVEEHLGLLRPGKEAQIDLVRRVAEDGANCLVVHKRYVPRTVNTKGELQSLGIERATTFRNDVEYREGRQFRRTRERRAVERMSSYGRRLLQTRWTGHEFDVMTGLWRAGVHVPYPISYRDEVFVLQFLGDLDRAAPQLARARLDPDELAVAAEQLRDGLAAIVSAGWAHGDLSAYNLLWWEDQLWFIDFPQAVDLAANPKGFDYLYRDVGAVSQWFTSRGHPIDNDELFAELVAL